MMQLVETIQLKKTLELSELCHKSKNLYNLGNYYINQNYDIMEKYLNWYDINWMLKTSIPFKKLPSQVSQNVLKYLHLAWKSYFESLKDWKKNPSKYKRMPQPPRYLPKNGEFIACFNHQHIPKKKDLNINKQPRYLSFPKKTNLSSIEIESYFKEINQVRIIPKNDIYNLEIIYNNNEYDINLDKNKMIAIDIGVNNLACVVNNIGLKPFSINGKPLKSINQHYNKMMAMYQSDSKINNDKWDTNKIKKLRRIRNNKIKDYMHKTSRHIINYCIEHDIGIIVIGKNDGWKQNVNLGKKNNQKFVQIPFEMLINQLEYKGQLVGIEIVKITEEYTSQTCCRCGIVKKSNRKYRGLYVCSQCGTKINADVNGAFNILKKAFPNVFNTDGIQGAQLHPTLINFNR